MTQRKTQTEANKSGSNAVMQGKRSKRSIQKVVKPSPSVLRMPAKYTVRDVEVLLDAQWQMFTESQAQKLKVAMPWGESDEPQQMVLADVAATLESWLNQSA